MRRSEGAGRKRKSGDDYSTELLESSVQLKTRRLARENLASPAPSDDSTCDNAGGGEVSAACCARSRSRGAESEFVDLEDEVEVAVQFLTESTCDSVDISNRNCLHNTVKQQSILFRSNKTPLTAVEFESPAASESNSPCHCTAEKTPTVAELEEFFSGAEKDLQKQFVDKYNYDIVEDKPLDGQYEWVQIQLKP